MQMQKKIMGGQEPPKWHQIYPQGTTAGSEEYKFFMSLSRHPKYSWRSVASIAKESGLSKRRVEEILQKYYKLGMVFQSEKTEDNWAYWERVPELLAPASVTVSAKDQGKRIAKAKSVLGTGGGSSGGNSGSAQGGSGASPIPQMDDDDDDTVCRVGPMTAASHGGYAITTSKTTPKFAYSTSIYSEGELADIDHLKKIASEASSETVRARATAALEARGVYGKSRSLASCDTNEDREAVLQRLNSRLTKSIKEPEKNPYVPEVIQASASPSPFVKSLKTMLAGASSVNNVTKRMA